MYWFSYIERHTIYGKSLIVQVSEDWGRERKAQAVCPGRSSAENTRVFVRGPTSAAKQSKQKSVRQNPISEKCALCVKRAFFLWGWWETTVREDDELHTRQSKVSEEVEGEREAKREGERDTLYFTLLAISPLTEKYRVVILVCSMIDVLGQL